ncbi:MAG: hypothetical protein HY908_31285 [Myxococcales bacterium]|nr:hypothetical protein [Myxococcales bacterium]
MIARRPALAFRPAVLAALAACAGPPAPTADPTFAAPAPADSGARCADVAAVRVCWDEAGAALGVVARPLPRYPAPPAGWRCHGRGRERVCVDRARGGGPFVCEAESCVQRHPRLPDDGEWECADLAGVVVCRGGAPPAGVVAGPPDPGWSCGTRAGHEDRVCVDPAPDTPRGEGRGWSCAFERERRGTRVCVRREDAPGLGANCAVAADCPQGARCDLGRCLPRAPAPDCWVDPDCGAGSRCAFGTCAPADE